MILLKKLWIALSISAFAALALAPAVVAAQGFYGDTSQQYNVNSQTTNNPPQTTYTSNPPSATYTSNPPSATYTSNPPSNVGGLTNPLGKVTGICQLLKILLNIAILTGVPIAMLFIVYAGMKLVLARGNPTALAAARQNLMWTFIGIAIFLGVWFFVQLLANTLGALGVQILGDCR